MLLFIEIHQNCASQTLILLCIAIFRKRSHACQSKMAAAPITVILKHFKVCIFQTVGPIFMKILPSIMVCKPLSSYVTLIFYVRFPLTQTGLFMSWEVMIKPVILKMNNKGADRPAHLHLCCSLVRLNDM